MQKAQGPGVCKLPNPSSITVHWRIPISILLMMSNLPAPTNMTPLQIHARTYASSISRGCRTGYSQGRWEEGAYRTWR